MDKKGLYLANTISLLRSSCSITFLLGGGRVLLCSKAVYVPPQSHM